MLEFVVNGKTEVYGVIGDPIAHSFSPQIHNTIAGASEDNMIYSAFHVKPENLGDAIRGAHALSIQGLNVTVPHKPFVMDFLCEIDSSALEAGAANTLKYTEKGYKGFNTDIYGIMNTFRHHQIVMKDKKGVVLGAGGTARAAVIAMARSGCTDIYIVNRTFEKAVYLAEQIKRYYNVNIEAYALANINEIDKADILIQTTSGGFGEQKDISPLPEKDFLKRIGTVLDVIYIPWKTKLLTDAENCGCYCINGFDMLIYQAVASYEIWHDKKMPAGFEQNILENLKIYYQNLSRR